MNPLMITWIQSCLDTETLQTVVLTAVIIVRYLSKWMPELVTVVYIGMIIVYLIAGIST